MSRITSAFVIVAALCLGGCTSEITSLDRPRVAPGETFTIRGRGLTDEIGPERREPILQRCGSTALEVLEWHEDHLVVRVPQGVAPGVYRVRAYGVPYGAYERELTNAVPIWVTAAHVDDTVTDQYEIQVRAFRARWDKSAEWERWMLDNRPRYENAVRASLAIPCPVKILVTMWAPIDYRPPWPSHAEHMRLLGLVGNGAFPGYHLDFSLFHDIRDHYARAFLGTPGSGANVRSMHLHYETIVNHEFGHIMGIAHHYTDLSTLGMGLNFPPGERGCTMDRDRYEYCSACRTALNLPLDVDNDRQIRDAMDLILARYPPGY
jgi:hypothetical protein